MTRRPLHTRIVAPDVHGACGPSRHHGAARKHERHLGGVLEEVRLLVPLALKRELEPEGTMKPGNLVPGSG